MSRYRKIDPRFWKDEKVRRLDQAEKLIALYCFTAQSNRVGLFNFSPGQGAEDLDMDIQTFRERFGNVCRILSFEWDEGCRVLYIPTWWKYNQPENANNVIGNLKDLDDVPETALFSRFSANLRYLDARFHKTFRERLPKRSPSQEQEQEQEQKQDKARSSSPDPGFKQEPRSVASPTKPLTEAGERDASAKEPAADLFGEPDLAAMSKLDKAKLLLTAWHTEAPHLPQPHRLNDRWIGHCVQRLEKYSLAQMTEIFRRLERSDLARDGNWASFEWVIKSEANCEKVLSGQYDNRGNVVRMERRRPETVTEAAMRELQEARERDARRREAEGANDDGSAKPGNSFDTRGDFSELEAGSGSAGGLRPVPRTFAV